MHKAEFIKAFVLARARAIVDAQFNYAQAVREASAAWALIQQELAK